MNSVRYICVDCGTHFDIPVTYVNRKVRCKCGFVDVATPTEVPAETPPPKYAPQPRYSSAPSHSAYSTPKQKKQKSQSPLMIGDRNVLVIVTNSLGSLFIVLVGFFFIKFISEISFRHFFSNMNGERAKVLFWLLGMLAGIFIYTVGQIQLLNRSRAGVVYTIIGFGVMTGLCFLAQEFIYLFFRLSFGNWGSYGDMVVSACLIFFLTIFPLFFVREGLD